MFKFDYEEAFMQKSDKTQRFRFYLLKAVVVTERNLNVGGS